MSSGKTHAKATAALAGMSAAFCYWQGYSQIVTLGVISGLVIHPDLDVDRFTQSDTLVREALKEILSRFTKRKGVLRVAENIGEIMGEIYFDFWLRYAIDQKHRGMNWGEKQVSHLPVIGTLDRVVYVFFGAKWFSVCVWAVIVSAGFYAPPDSIVAFIAGLSLADFLHIVMDVVSSWWRKK